MIPGTDRPDLPPSVGELKAERDLLLRRLAEAEASGKDHERRYVEMAERVKGLEAELLGHKAPPTPPPPVPPAAPAPEADTSADAAPAKEEGGEGLFDMLGL